MEKEIENLIEELTKVRPEMLNEEALKLFNTIMAVLDERDKLIKRIDRAIEYINLKRPVALEDKIIKILKED